MRALFRKLFRIRLATLLVMVTVLSLWLGWLSYTARRQREAAKFLTAADIDLYYDDREDQENRSASGKTGPTTRDRIEAWIGRDYFHTIDTAGFAMANGRRKGSKEPRATLPGLTNVELSHNESVKDDQLAYLTGLSKLHVLYLYHTAVRGPGLEHIARLPRLEHLDLSRSPVEDDGLFWIGKLPRLKSLRLETSKVTDAGIAYLVGLEQLEELSLKNTDVADAGLEHVAQLRGLKTVNLFGSKVTWDGVQSLQQRLPGCRISTVFWLGKTAVDVEFFPPGTQPSMSELNARLKELNIEGGVTANPSTQGPNNLHLSSSILSDESTLRLIALIPSLRFITIRNAFVGDPLVKGLASNDRLKYLSLPKTQITNDGLVDIAKLTNLDELVIDQTQITDEGLPHLYQMKNLRSLILYDTRVTDEAVLKLKQALPGCHIHR